MKLAPITSTGASVVPLARRDSESDELTSNDSPAPGERSTAKLISRRQRSPDLELASAVDEQDAMELAPVTEASRWRAFMERCAAEWCERSGGEALRQASDRTYEELAEGTPSEVDAEQIAMDVERSGVDGLELVVTADFDEAAHLRSLRRLFTALCCRQAGLYCQGMNFVASVLLAVMEHQAEPPTADGHSRGEVAAFWTLLALVALLPADFYDAPSMPGLQCEARLLKQLVRAELPSCEAATVSGAPLSSVLQLVSYKWFVPLYVNQLPSRTLLLFWDRLLIPPRPAATSNRFAAGGAGVIGASVTGCGSSSGSSGGKQRVRTESSDSADGATSPSARRPQPSASSSSDGAAADATPGATLLRPAKGGPLQTADDDDAEAAAAAAGAYGAYGGAFGGGGGPPQTTAHLQLSLALLEGCLPEVGRAMEASGDEAMGVGLERVLNYALGVSGTASGANELLRRAARYELDGARLRYLRRALATPPPGAVTAAAAAATSGARGGSSTRRRAGPPAEPELGRMQRTALRLAARRQHERLPTRLLKDALLLRPPQAPPVASLLAVRSSVPAQRLVTFCASPPQIARLASACSVLVASLFVWCVRALIVGRERA